MAKSRARKKAAEAEVTQPTVTESTTTTQPADEATPAEREAAHTTGHQRTAANENGHAARHHQHREPGQSHAAVGKRSERQPGYTDGFRDRVIGAHRRELHYPFLSIIRFEEKPSEQVRKKLHDEGFTWEQRNIELKRPINYDSRQQDKESARRVFDEVCQMIRTERGITHNYGGPS